MLIAFALCTSQFVSLYPIAAQAAANICDRTVGRLDVGAITTQAPLEALVTLETRIRTLVNWYVGLSISDPSIDQQLALIESQFDATVALADEHAEGSTVFSNKLNLLIKSIQSAESQLIEVVDARAVPHSAADSQEISDLERILERPELMQPGKLYNIEGIDPTTTQVAFSADVIEAVFQSAMPLMKRAVSLIFRSLQRGRMHATDRSGVIPFTNDGTVFKVKITGQAVGAIRLAGFFVGERFYVVAWSNNPNHTGLPSIRLTQYVNGLRAQFQRTGKI